MRTFYVVINICLRSSLTQNYVRYRSVIIYFTLRFTCRYLEKKKKKKKKKKTFESLIFCCILYWLFTVYNFDSVAQYLCMYTIASGDGTIH